MIKRMRFCRGLLIMSLMIGFGYFDLSSSALARPTHVMQNTTVEEVAICGNQHVSSKAILKQVKTRPGQRYDKDQAGRDFQAILKMGFFDPLKSKIFTETGPKGGMIVTFDLSEYPDGKRHTK